MKRGGKEINNYGLSDKEAKEFRGEKHCRLRLF
jgi:hypothetical protein